MYTSIDNNTVIDSFLFLRSHLDKDTCTINLMLDFFDYIKHNDYFHIEFKHLFLQKQDLAMGSYDSTDIAHLVLFISEIRLLKFSWIANRILYMARWTDIPWEIHGHKNYYPVENKKKLHKEEVTKLLKKVGLMFIVVRLAIVCNVYAVLMMLFLTFVNVGVFFF